MTEIGKQIGILIHNRRREVGMTQQQLAKALEISNNAVSNLERGFSTNIALVERACELMDIKLKIKSKLL